MRNRFGMYLIVLSYFMLALAGCDRKQDYTGNKQLFDLNWKFCQGDITSAIEIDFNDTLWRNLDLPHDWSIDEKLKNINSINDDEVLASDVGWYRKKFLLPSNWKNKQVTIHFESVNMETQVYLNENYLGKNINPTNSLHFDLTPFLKYNKKNIIAIRVNKAQQKDGKWLKGTGMPEHIWLLVADPV